MGTGLIFPGQEEVTDRGVVVPYRIGAASERFLETALHQIVPETDTGGLVEHTEALERTTLKELGKMPP